MPSDIPTTPPPCTGGGVGIILRLKWAEEFCLSSHSIGREHVEHFNTLSLKAEGETTGPSSSWRRAIPSHIRPRSFPVFTFRRLAVCSPGTAACRLRLNHSLLPGSSRPSFSHQSFHSSYKSSSGMLKPGATSQRSRTNALTVPPIARSPQPPRARSLAARNNRARSAVDSQRCPSSRCPTTHCPACR